LVTGAKDTQAKRKPLIAQWEAADARVTGLAGTFELLPPGSVYGNMVCDIKHSRSCENELVLYRQLIADHLAGVKAGIAETIQNRDGALTERNTLKQSITVLAATEKTEHDLAAAKVTECTTLGDEAKTAMCNLKEPLKITCDFEASFQANTAAAPQISSIRQIQHQITNIGRCASDLYLKCDDHLTVEAMATCLTSATTDVAWPVNTLQDWAQSFPEYSCSAASPTVKLGKACTAGSTATIINSEVVWNSNIAYDTALASIKCDDQDLDFGTCPAPTAEGGLLGLLGR